MSCPKTRHLMLEYFSEDLSPVASEELQRHVQSCEHCSAELESILLTHSQLQGWQDEKVPHWDRGMELFRREHRSNDEQRSFWHIWNWIPTAASFAMLCVLLLNTTVSSSADGFSISFGTSANEAALQNTLAEFERRQQADLQAMAARFEERQDSNNVQLLEAVLSQTQQTTAENLDIIYSYFEQQRLQDLQAMRAGYQDLLDSDYETIRTLQQLAQYVSYEGNLR